MIKNITNSVFALFCFVIFLGSSLHAETRIAVPISAEIGAPAVLDPTDGFVWEGTSELRPEWTWEDRPATSVAQFSDPDVLRPSVTLDVAGTFVARVDFYDAADAAATTPLVSTTVTLSTENLAPVAQIAKRGLPDGDRPLILDGSKSYDVDGDAITYVWSVANAPTGGTATFSDPAGIFTEVSLEGAGLFELALNVQDETGQTSAPSIVRVLREGGSVDAPELDLQATLGHFNLVTEQFFGRQEVEGRTYIDSTITRTNGQFGFDIENDGLPYNELYVNGDIVRSNINLTPGDIAKIAGVRIQSNVNNGALIENATDLPNFDFEAFKDQSAFLATLTGEPADTADQNHKRFGGPANAIDGEAIFGPNTRIVNTSLNKLNTGGYSIDLSQADTVIINVAGTQGRFQMNPLGGTPSAERVIWNFYEATSVNINSVVVGHILAPHARLRGFAGSSEGSVIAQNVRLTNGELHQRSWLGQVPAPIGGAVEETQSVAPTASLTFDAVVAKANGSFVLDPFASTSVDGEMIPVQAQIVSAPTGGIATALTDDLGYITVTTDVPGDYVVSLKAGGGDLATYDQVLVTNGGNVRPVARIADIATTRPIGAAVVLNGSGSYDLDGDLLSYRWSILSQPEGSSTQIDNSDRVFPTITPDIDGLYVVQLIASDAQTHSVPVTQIIDTQVILPRAVVSPDQVVDAAGAAPVTGSGSTGSDYTWSVLGFSNSGATSVIADPTQADTTLTLNAEADGSFGLSVAQLIVADNNGISLPSNVAAAGADLRPYATDAAQVVANGGVATTLDGASLALDPNGDVLAFNWSLIAKPQNSNAAVDQTDPERQTVTSETLDFVPDVSGLYIIQLVADAGALCSVPSTVVIVVENSAPVAIASTIPNDVVGQTVTLDASGSFDPDGDALSFGWSFVSAPEGSAAAVQNATQPISTFVPDRVGIYEFVVTVSDFEFDTVSSPVTLVVENRAPVAVLSGPDNFLLSQTIVLDALGSSDPDGNTLSFSVILTSSPAGAEQSILSEAFGLFNYTPTVAGDYAFELTASDGVESSTAVLNYTAFAGNNAPILDDLQDVYDAELGLEFVLDLNGSDPDGDPTEFFTATLPLPPGVTLQADTGLLKFRPEVGQEGVYNVVLGITDGTLTDEVAIQINVVPGTSATASIFGFVFDQVDFANGLQTPLAGMPVRLEDAGLETTTDSDGRFAFSGLIENSDVVIVDPSAAGGPGGYIAEVRSVAITPNQDRDIAPAILLTPFNEGCVTVLPGQETVLTGVVSGVSLSIAADTILDADGNAFTGEVCLGALPQQTSIEGFSDGVNACQVYGLSAPGAVFSSGAVVTAPNYDNLPETAELELWQRQVAGGFRQTANAFVEPGAVSVRADLRRLSSGSLFTFLPQAPTSIASADQPTGNRYKTILEGDLNENYMLPGYFAFNQSQNVGLSYHSSAADQTTIVAGDVTIAETAGLPNELETRLNIGGLQQVSEKVWSPRLSLNGRVPLLVGEAVTLRQATSLDATGLPSGRHEYDFTAQARYDCSTVSSTHTSEVYVQNEADSPYGAGWSIDGLQKLTQNPDGSIAIIDDNGLITFNPAATLTEFASNPLVFPAVGAQTLAIADFDLDGETDVIFSETGTGSIGFIRNQTGRDFEIDKFVEVADPVEVPQTGEFPPNLIDVVMGELSGDDVLDIGYNLQLQDGFGILENDGLGAFNPIVTEADIGFRPINLIIADLDQDGLDDLIFGGFRADIFGRSNQIWVRYGAEENAQLERLFSRDVPDDTELTQLLAEDLDLDGDLDIAYRDPNQINIIFNQGNRVFQGVSRIIPAETDLLKDKRFDFINGNSDGRPDIVVITNNKLFVYDNISGGLAWAPTELDEPAGMTGVYNSVRATDINADGIDDLIFSVVSDAGAGPSGIVVYEGNGDNTFQPPEVGLLDYAFSALEVVDLDGDGSQDIVTTQRFSVTVQFSDPLASGEYVAGNGEFSSLTRLPDGSWARRYKTGEVAEFDANGFQTALVDTQGNRCSFSYDVDGRLISIVDQVGGETSFAYDAAGKLETVTYPDGRVTSFAFDPSSGTLSKVTEPTGSMISYSYDDANRLTGFTNPNGNASSYSYDAFGNIAGAEFADGSGIKIIPAESVGLINEAGEMFSNPLSFVEPDDRVTTIVDRKGETTRVTTNSFGAAVEVVDPLGRVSKIMRDEDNLAIRVEQPSAVSVGGVRLDAMSYDTLGNLTELTEAVGTSDERVTSYEFEPVFSNVTRMTDPDGFETQYTFDAFGEVTGMTDPEGGQRSYTYNPQGKLLSATDENGNLTSYLYAANQNLAQMTYADGSISTIVYDATGNRISRNEAVGTPIEQRVQRTFDDLNRVLTVEVTGADGVQIDGITSYSYLPAGNLATVTDETGLVTTLDYDGLERLVAIDDPASGTSERIYNEAGELISRINSAGETNTYVYDEVSRLIETTDPEGFVKAFAYDTRDNTTRVTDGRGGATLFDFDALDRVIRRTDPVGQAIQRQYDDRGNLIRLTREDGLPEIARYDGLNRLTRLDTLGQDPGDDRPPEGFDKTDQLRYAYDPRSNLISAADRDSRVTFGYDERNRLISATTDGTVGPQPEVTISYQFDELNRRIGMSDSLGGTTSYAYDPESRLTDLTSPWGTVYSFGYDGEGRRTSLTSTTGRDTSYAYTNGLLSELVHVQSGVALTNLSYGYDVDAQLNQITDNLDPTKSLTISYDDLNRLVQVDQGVPASDGGTPIPIEDFAYDEEGNRLASTNSAMYVSNNHNQLLEDRNFTYAYDVRGNRISRRAKDDPFAVPQEYEYNSQNRLVVYRATETVTRVIEGPRGPQTIVEEVTTESEYAYDALGRRIAKTVDGVTEAFVYDSWSMSDPVGDDVLLDFSDGALVKRWQHGNKVDEPLAFEAYQTTTLPGDGIVYELFADRLGSILSVVDTSTGSVAASYVYDSFGKRTQVGSLDQRYGFTGREVDDENGLIYYRARHYDPLLGQFIQRDPIGFTAGDYNLYAYAWNDPYNWTDPSGLAIAIPWIIWPCVSNPGGCAAGAAAAGRGALAALQWALRKRAADVIVDSLPSVPAPGLGEGGEAENGEAENGEAENGEAENGEAENGEVTTPGEREIGELETIDGSAHNSPRPELQGLSDDELLGAIRDPENGDPVTVLGNDVRDGNGRIKEAQGRGLGGETIPVDQLPAREPIAPWEQ